MLSTFIISAGLILLGFIAGFVVRRTTEQWIIVKLKDQAVEYKRSIARYQRIMTKPFPVRDELLASAEAVLRQINKTSPTKL